MSCCTATSASTSDGGRIMDDGTIARPPTTSTSPCRPEWVLGDGVVRVVDDVRGIDAEIVNVMEFCRLNLRRLARARRCSGSLRPDVSAEEFKVPRRGTTSRSSACSTLAFRISLRRELGYESDFLSLVASISGMRSSPRAPGWLSLEPGSGSAPGL